MCKFLLLTCHICFDVALTDIEATLKERWDLVITTSKQHWNDIVQRWKMVALTLCNVDLMLFQSWTPTLYQYCATLKIRFRILFHFQRWINVIWTVVYNVEAKLIRHWNVGWIVSMKKLILRSILPASLLTKWNL